MASTGRDRHRDRDGGWRRDDVQEAASTDRVFRISEGERQTIAKSLRFIDDARRSLEQQQNPDNREIIRELRASADRIFDVVNRLEEIAPGEGAAEP
jgi:hypothetical protein